jgi:hypothetical protein
VWEKDEVDVLSDYTQKVDILVSAWKSDAHAPALEEKVQALVHSSASALQEQAEEVPPPVTPVKPVAIETLLPPTNERKLHQAKVDEANEVHRRKHEAAVKAVEHKRAKNAAKPVNAGPTQKVGDLFAKVFKNVVVGDVETNKLKRVSYSSLQKGPAEDTYQLNNNARVLRKNIFGDINSAACLTRSFQVTYVCQTIICKYTISFSALAVLLSDVLPTNGPIYLLFMSYIHQAFDDPVSKLIDTLKINKALPLGCYVIMKLVVLWYRKRFYTPTLQFSDIVTIEKSPYIIIIAPPSIITRPPNAPVHQCNCTTIDYNKTS